VLEHLAQRDGLIGPVRDEGTREGGDREAREVIGGRAGGVQPERDVHLAAQAPEASSRRRRTTRCISPPPAPGDCAARTLELVGEALRQPELAAAQAELYEHWRAEFAAMLEDLERRGVIVLSGPARPLAELITAVGQGLGVQQYTTPAGIGARR
jgi:hypothetical protein